jgi:hypothetical protein
MQNQQASETSPIDSLADTVTNNVTNTYSKVFGDPTQNQRASVPGTKVQQNKRLEASPLKGTKEKIENMTNMLNIITESLSDKDKTSANKKETQPELNLQKIASFFKNSDAQNNTQKTSNVAGLQAQKIPTIIPKKQEEPKSKNTIPSYSTRFQNMFTNKGSVPLSKSKTYTPDSDSNSYSAQSTAIRERTSNSENAIPQPQSFTKPSQQSPSDNSNVSSNMSSDTMSKYLQSVALMESGGKADAQASTSSAAGLFQFTKGTWGEISKRMGKDWKEEDRFDPQKSAQAAEYLTNLNKSQIEKSIGREATAKDLYMGHFLGGGGASNFLKEMSKNPSKSAAEVAGEAAAKANQSIFYKQDGTARSLQEVYDLMGSKMEKAQTAIETGKIGKRDLPETIANIRSQKAQEEKMIAAAQPQQAPQIDQNARLASATVTPQGQPSATVLENNNVMDMVEQKTAVPESEKPKSTVAEMEQQPQRQTGLTLTNMASDQQSTRDQMNQPQAPVINNISSGGGGGMQSVPQSSAANAPIASVRNEENAFVRMQNMMALQAMS